MRSVVAAVIGIVSITAVIAASAEPPPGAMACSGCHPSSARASSPVIRLAGRDRAEIVKAMREFRSGERAATVMDGPQFSTRAESETNRRLGFDIIGMTNLAEAKLAREAEIALATVAMVTDYDCWKTDEEPVTSDAVVAHLHANAETAKSLLTQVIPRIPAEADWPEHRALDMAFVTARDLWPAEARERLRPILSRFL